jgi:hypothetical protein
MSVHPIDKVLRVLNTYNGRDKTIRTAYFSLIILSTKAKNADLASRILAFAKQLSLTRLVLRQLNHFPLIVSLLRSRRDIQNAKDKLDSGLNATVTLIYLVQSFVEFGAWVADAKLIGLNAPKWYRGSLYLVLISLVIYLFSYLVDSCNVCRSDSSS